jgi:hypothetical protein
MLLPELEWQNMKGLFICLFSPGLFTPINKKRTVAHIQTLSAAGVAPGRMSVSATAYRLIGEMVISNNLKNITETARYDWLNSFLRRNPELSCTELNPFL